eukprot:g14130.t1
MFSTFSVTNWPEHPLPATNFLRGLLGGKKPFGPARLVPGAMVPWADIAVLDLLLSLCFVLPPCLLLPHRRCKYSFMASHDEVQDALITDLRTSVNGAWLIICGAMVLFMQAGFALIEVGSVSEQNTQRVMMKNVADALVGLIVFYFIGFGIAFGKDWHGFIGISYFVIGLSDPHMLGFYFFQAAFCCTRLPIVSGAVAERVKFKAYFFFSAFMSAWIYPVVAHWVWGGGFLSPAAPNPFLGVGMYDFAGSAVVHLCGGTAALLGAIMVGPRYRFIDPKTGKGVVVPGSNKLHVTVGGFILWFGWFCFNSGSAYQITDGAIDLAYIAACNTALGGAAGGAGVVLWEGRRRHIATLSDIVNGMLAGLVTITAGCSVIEPYLTLVFCALSGVCTTICALKLRAWLIDDPVGAVAVHFVGGWIGIIAVGLAHHKTGLFYSGNFAQLEVQIVGAFIIMIWSAVWSLLMWAILDYTIGIRMPFFAELEGFFKTSKNFVDTCDYVEAGYFQEKQPLLSADYHKIFKFHEYLEKEELSGEILDFLLCVQHWKVMMTAVYIHPDARNATRDTGGSTGNLTVQSGVKRRTIKVGNEQIESILPFAQAIGDMYIRPKSDMEINVSASVRKKIMEDLDHANKVGVHLMMATIFDRAALDVQIELRHGPWQRFIEHYMADMTDTRIFNDVPVSWLTRLMNKRKTKLFGTKNNVKHKTEKVLVTFKVSTDAVVTWREMGDFTESRSSSSHSHDLGSPPERVRVMSFDSGGEKNKSSARNMLVSTGTGINDPSPRASPRLTGRERTGFSLPNNEDNAQDLAASERTGFSLPNNEDNAQDIVREVSDDMGDIKIRLDQIEPADRSVRPHQQRDHSMDVTPMPDVGNFHSARDSELGPFDDRAPASPSIIKSSPSPTSS